MGVTDDLTLSVQLLRCREVVALCVHKVTSLHVLDRHGDGECRVGCDVLHVRGVGELARRHRGCGGDLSHRSGVARSALNLETVGDGLPGGSTEVDEVI